METLEILLIKTRTMWEMVFGDSSCPRRKWYIVQLTALWESMLVSFIHNRKVSKRNSLLVEASRNVRKSKENRKQKERSLIVSLNFETELGALG